MLIEFAAKLNFGLSGNTSHVGFTSSDSNSGMFEIWWATSFIAGTAVKIAVLKFSKENRREWMRHFFIFRSRANFVRSPARQIEIRSQFFDSVPLPTTWWISRLYESWRFLEEFQFARNPLQDYIIFRAARNSESSHLDSPSHENLR